MANWIQAGNVWVDAESGNISMVDPVANRVTGDLAAKWGADAILDPNSGSVYLPGQNITVPVNPDGSQDMVRSKLNSGNVFTNDVTSLAGSKLGSVLSGRAVLQGGAKEQDMSGSSALDVFGSPATAGTDYQDAARLAAILYGGYMAGGALAGGAAGEGAAAGATAAEGAGAAGGFAMPAATAESASALTSMGLVETAPGVWSAAGAGGAAGAAALPGAAAAEGGYAMPAAAAEGGVTGAGALSAGGGATAAGGLTGALSNPSLLGAGAGALLGGLGGSSQSGTTTTSEGIPDWLMPYVKPQLDKYSTELQNYQTDPYGIMPSAMQEFQKTIQGQYLDPSTNKYLEDYFRLGSERIKGSLSPTFGHMQAFGQHSGYNEALSRGLGDFATGLYGGNYAKERDRQTQMTAAAPAFLGQSSQAQFQPYSQYLQSVGSLGKKKEEPYFQNQFGNILGGAMFGSQFGNAFK